MNDVSGDMSSDDSEWSADQLIPFGKYVLLDRINSGATAAVYRANVRGEAGFERLVAIKRILPHMAGDRDFVDTFVREAKTVARLAHAGICPIYELGKVGESLYMAVEYIQGRDLGQIMRRLARRGMPMPPIVSAFLGARLCDALDYAHSLKNVKGARTGIIHRDLSPSNILVSYEGQVKLIDFGLAKAVGRAQSTNVDALKKKLSYMSPEMVKGRQIDARSDIFGVGICLYEMITGRRLFAGVNDIDTLKMVGRASVPPPSAVIEDAPDELEVVAMHALEREPEDRYQSAAEMGEALQAYIAETDPTFNSLRLAEWMHELFAVDIEEERAHIKRLLAASADPELIKERRVFFASPSGAAARARAELARRMSTEPPPAKQRRGQGPVVPKAAAIPQEARAGIEDEPTEFYDSEKTRAAPAGHAQRIFEEEPTGFYDADKARPKPVATPRTTSEEPTSAFEDEPTQFLVGDEDGLEIEPLAAGAAAQSGTGGFDEEPTEIFFNKEDGVGIQELIEEINEIEPDGPLNKPIIAPELLAEPLAPPAAQPMGMQPRFPTPGPMPVPAGLRRNTPPPMQVPPGLLQRNTPPPIQVPPGLAQRNTPPPMQVPPAIRRNTPGPIQAPPGIHRNTPTPIQAPPPRAGAPTLEIQLPQKRSTTWPIAAGVIVVLVAITALIWKTPVGVAIGVRAPETGAIEVRTTPEVWADVLLDGVFRGHAPLRIGGVRAGTRRLTVQAKGYLPVAKEITIRGGGTLLIDLSLVPEAPPAPPPEPPKVEQPAPTTPEKHDPYTRKRETPHPTEGASTPPPATVVAPKPSGGTLVINTVPWSLVFIDGRDTGRNTPLLNYPISAGAHELRLQTANGQVHVEHLEVQPGQTVSITRRF